MIRISYSFTTVQPLHTGSDENLGTLRTLRREKTIVRNPRPVFSRFTPDQKRLKRQALALLLLRVWEKMPTRNRVTIYEELAGKLLASTAVRTKEEFLQTLCRKLDIREITTDANRRFDVVDILELFDDYELLTLIRSESQYIMTMFRKIKDENMVWQKASGKAKVAKETVFGHDDLDKRSPEVVIMDELMPVYDQPRQRIDLGGVIDYVPVISGNSLKGLLRRLCMYDFCLVTGIDSLSPQTYHMLFTGGVINDSSGFENIEQREKLIRLCPMLGLFGSAIGNQTIQGELKVGQARLQCLENGTGSLSYHDQVDVIFGTRLDSAKLENKLTLVGEDPATHQMKYEYEVYAPGAVFDHSFGCTSRNALIVSTFWRMLRQLKDQPYITAKSSIGHGEIDLSDLLIPDDADALYLEHLRTHQDAMLDYWQVAESVPA